jgi:hypothetical protein
MGGACSEHGERREMRTKFWLSLNGRDHRKTKALIGECNYNGS